MQPIFLCLLCLVSKETEAEQDSEADTTSSNLRPSSVDIQTLIHRNEPNRPHIPSVIQQCQRAYTKRSKADRRANLMSATAYPIFEVTQSSPSAIPSFRAVKTFRSCVAAAPSSLPP